MKEDYEKINAADDFIGYFIDNLDSRQKNIFKSTLNSQTHKEFDLYMKNYELEVENEHLKELLDRPIVSLISSKLR